VKSDRCIIWSIDPFERKAKPSKQAVLNLARWTDDLGYSLLPVTVIPPEENESALFQKIQATEKELESFVEAYDTKLPYKAKLIVSQEKTRDSMVDELLRYAKKRNAEYIAISTHGRSIVGRMILGSFAEHLLKRSTLPVLFLGRHTEAYSQNNRRQIAMFPADFSEHSQRAYRYFLPLALKLKVELIIFHFVCFPIWGEGMQLPSEGEYEKYQAEQLEMAQKLGKVWLAEAQSLGIPARLNIIENGIGLLTGDLLFDYALQEAADLVVLASKKGAIDRVWFGSVAYEALRHARIPILVYGPKCLMDVRKHKIGDEDAEHVA
jgi:nucleotide-binding universal stress UspA family protein